jgi:hypothetical protein
MWRPVSALNVALLGALLWPQIWTMTPQIEENGAMVLLVEADATTSTQQQRTTTTKVFVGSGEMLVVGFGGSDRHRELLLLIDPQIVAAPPG